MVEVNADESPFLRQSLKTHEINPNCINSIKFISISTYNSDGNRFDGRPERSESLHSSCTV